MGERVQLALCGNCAYPLAIQDGWIDPSDPFSCAICGAVETPRIEWFIREQPPTNPPSGGEVASASDTRTAPSTEASVADGYIEGLMSTYSPLADRAGRNKTILVRRFPPASDLQAALDRLEGEG